MIIRPLQWMTFQLQKPYRHKTAPNSLSHTIRLRRNLMKLHPYRPYLNSKFSETAKDCVTDLEYFLARRGRYTSCGDQNIRINGEEHRAIVTTYSLKYFDSKDIDKIISYTYKKNIDLYLSFPDVVKEHIENS